MKGSIQTSTSKIEPGVHQAVLVHVDIYLMNKYQSGEVEPCLVLTWYFGDDTNGNAVTLTDIVRIPRDRNGLPTLNDASKLYERISALYGERFTVKNANAVNWELKLPGEYDSPSGLMALPHFDERKEEDFNPVGVRSIMVNDTECIGLEAQLTVIEKGDYVVVKETVPMPKKSAFRRKLEPFGDNEESNSLPI